MKREDKLKKKEYDRNRYLLLRERLRSKTKKYSRTCEGYKNSLYRSMIKRSIYFRREITISKSEFLIFLDKSNFQKLFKVWEQEGYKKRLAPSIDRINNKLGYSLENIQVITHGANSKKKHEIDYPFNGFSKKWQNCTSCGSSTKKHSGHGHCKSCYYKFYYPLRQAIESLQKQVDSMTKTCTHHKPGDVWGGTCSCCDLCPFRSAFDSLTEKKV